MRLRVRLKSLVALALLCSCAVIYNFVGIHLGNLLDIGEDASKTRRVARITADDLLSVGRYSDPALSPITVRNPAAGIRTIINITDIKNLDVSSSPENVASLRAPPGATGNLQSQAPLVGPVVGSHGNRTPASSRAAWLPEPSKNEASPRSTSKSSCDGNCHDFRKLRQQSLDALSQIRSRRVTKTRGKDGKFIRVNPCDQACRLAKLKNHGSHRGGYSSRVQVENVTLPDSWTVTRELVDRLSARRSHVHEVCNKYGLNKPSSIYQPNAWEFLLNAKYGLVWCNVFKAASSTWFYNFNLLAGYTEQELLHAKETPIQLARKRYARPTIGELHQAMNSTQQPLSFMIARHPLERLVSGYRDKILSGNRYYSKLARNILRQYKDFGYGEEKDKLKSWSFFGKSAPKSVVPSFPQFVQFLVDETAKGRKLDEHWTPISQFCTPCLVDFDVFAKVETMEEDGNYIIFSAGIQDVIKPKRINRSRNEPTDAVADKFLCQLSGRQMDSLIKLYKYDIELFEYDVTKYINCTRS